MLPGQTYTPEDIARILWRRKWLVAAPLALAAGLAFAVSGRIPKVYRSETVILIVPQRVPESYVRSTVTTRLEDRLASISPQILSRPRLERIIETFNLYPDLRRTHPMEEVVERMRSAIDIRVERGDAFRVSYSSADPRLAQKVTERLAALFIEENLHDREVQASGTSQFLDSQLEEARQRLLEQEKKLEQYKRRYTGQLPTQVQVNLQAIQNLQLQLQALTDSMSRDRDRRLLLERQLADARSADAEAAALAAAAGPPSSADAERSPARELEAARARLAALELRYKPEHPDVKAARRTVAELEARLPVEAAPQEGARVAPEPPRAGDRKGDNRTRELELEIQNLELELGHKQEQERQLHAAMAAYQADVEAAPTREAELTELTRDYTTLQNSYTSLLAKREESRIAADLERNQIGEQFKILDPARVPERPFSPNVMKINLAGAGGGLLIGLALVALLEYLDSSFRSEADVARVLELPVLALIPLMRSERERRVRRRLVLASAAILAAAGSAAWAAWKIHLS